MIPIMILSDEQYELGLLIGRARQEEDEERNLETKFEANPGDRFKKHELGALCELAFWRFIFPNIPWEPAPMKGTDVGSFQVRGTEAHGDGYASLGRCRLPIRKWDYDGDRIALIIQYSHKIYVVRGWIWVGEGRRVGACESLRGLPPAHWVEQSKLREF
jgi:hypothetical protein